MTQALVPLAPCRDGGLTEDGQESHPGVRNAPAHFVQNARLVVHGAPTVCHADGQIKLRADRESGGIGSDEVQPASCRSVTSLNQIRFLVVYSHADAETVAQHSEMPSGAAPDIDHGHPFDHDVVEQLNFGLQEGTDFGRLG
jgi:hypothetical protein